MKKLIPLLLILTSCGPKFAPLPKNGEVMPDGAVVRARAYLTVIQGESPLVAQLKKTFLNFIIPQALAYNGSSPTATVVVNYTNAESVNFSLNTTGLESAPSLTGNTLNLGNFSIASLSDNKLRVCTSPTKCQRAAIRAYTTGSIAGFVNTTDGDYGAPVYLSGQNPSTNLGLGSANSVETETIVLPNNLNKLTDSAFSLAPYSLSSDFSNAGAGQYQMTLVIEYILRN